MPSSPFPTTPAFQDAASHLSSSTAAGNISNAVKLEIYGLYKCLTVSPKPATPRPSFFDMTARAKWDAWNHAGTVYGENPVNAEARYLHIARSLGWVRGARSVDRGKGKADTGDADDGLPDDWETRETPTTGGDGMAISVSAMAPPSVDAEDAFTIHGLAISDNDDADVLASFLDAHAGTNVDALDESGYTPLHMAADRGNAKIVALLLNRGADPGIKDPDEYTALELARVARHEEVVNLITEKVNLH
ncbi:hypothetical protein PLICRDRAFT_36092 [Plicaturopsis crispa FD-325 SS-3]|nr:hypothetical protein PLICRDRAFT_36092 [Plicaturopsis crispa FD-325 SS-3]